MELFCLSQLLGNCCHDAEGHRAIAQSPLTDDNVDFKHILYTPNAIFMYGNTCRKLDDTQFYRGSEAQSVRQSE